MAGPPPGSTRLRNPALFNAVYGPFNRSDWRGIYVQRQRAKFFVPQTGIANTIGERLSQRRADLGKLPDLMGQLAVS